MSYSDGNTISFYVQSKSSLFEKICAIQAVIDALELRLVDVAAGQAAVKDSYSMDDGQMKVTTSYRSVAEVVAGVNQLEKLKNKYINQHNGRSVVLRDAFKLQKPYY